MSQAKIKITIGNTTVEVEAPIEKIEEAVKNVVSALRNLDQAQQIKPSAQPKRTVTCRKAVEELAAAGWFRTGRTLSEVVSELERRGFFYDTTAVAHVLLDLVRSGVLERVGETRRYVYVEPSKPGLAKPQTAAEDSAR
ncbi:MAG: hypothetical protein QXF95_06825 [Candidatus Caldarchaeum sp.]